MVHSRKNPFTMHLFEVLNSNLDFPSGLPSPSRWQRLQPLKLYVRSVIRGEKVFRQNKHYVESFSSIAEVLLLAIRILLQRLAGCC